MKHPKKQRIADCPLTIDLATARPGDIFRTQDGQEAVFIAYDAKLKRPFIFRVNDTIWTRNQDGRHCNKCNGLVYPAIIGKK